MSTYARRAWIAHRPVAGNRHEGAVLRDAGGVTFPWRRTDSRYLASGKGVCSDPFRKFNLIAGEMGSDLECKPRK